MINCPICDKPVHYTHAYKLVAIIDDYDASIVIERGIAHVNCADPTAHPHDGKPGPKFETMTSNQRQIAQNNLYKAV